MTYSFLFLCHLVSCSIWYSTVKIVQLTHSLHTRKIKFGINLFSRNFVSYHNLKISIWLNFIKLLSCCIIPYRLSIIYFYSEILLTYDESNHLKKITKQSARYVLFINWTSNPIRCTICFPGNMTAMDITN